VIRDLRSLATYVGGICAWTITVCGLTMLVGCTGQPSRIGAIKIDVAQTAKMIFANYDKDLNESLSPEELIAVPPINAKRNWYDADENGQISVDELRKGLQAIFNAKDGLLSVPCEVTRNGKPLAGANVKLVPLPELEGVIPPASGTTDKQGAAMLNVDQADRPANTPERIAVVRPGLYLVQVTHDQIRIPDEYNVKTKLGNEISRFTTAGGPMKIQLKF
jgi:hypothetical protein